MTNVEGTPALSVLDSIRADARRYAVAKGLTRRVRGWRWPAYVCVIAIARGFHVLAWHRCSQSLFLRYRDREGVVARGAILFCKLGRYLMVVMTKTWVDRETLIAPGVYLSNKGNIIIGARAIGTGCVIQRNVTIGMDNTSPKRERPAIGDKVWIGTGSLVFGGISIGNGTTLLEGTVLARTVPPNCVVKGNPARIVKQDYNNEVLLAQPEAHSTALVQC